MQQWLGDVRCWGQAGRSWAGERMVWMDNTSGNSGGEETAAARALRMRVRFLPPKATDLVHPADHFPIQRIKERWRRLCEKRNMEAIRRGEWVRFQEPYLTRGRIFAYREQRSACAC